MILAMAAVLAASGCSADADRAAVDASVAQLHQMMDAGRYHDIYAGAADEFRQSASEENGIRFLRAMHDRLGAFRSSSPTGRSLDISPDRSMVYLTYDTQFAQAAGTEDIVFRIDGGTAHLAGYHVQSRALIGANALAPAQQANPSQGAAPPAPATVAPAEPPKPSEPEPEPEGGK
jgi:hypothetical protein